MQTTLEYEVPLTSEQAQVPENKKAVVSSPVLKLARSYYQQLVQEGTTEIGEEGLQHTRDFWRSLRLRLQLSTEPSAPSRLVAVHMVAALQLLHSLPAVAKTATGSSLHEPRSLLQSIPGSRASTHCTQLELLQLSFKKSAAEIPWQELVAEAFNTTLEISEIQEYITRPTAPKPEAAENR